MDPWSLPKIQPGCDSHHLQEIFKVTYSLLLTMQHCSVSGPSICTQKHIRRYFLNETLPEPGTVCAVDASPFPASGSDSDDADIDVQAQAILGVPAEDRELSEAVWKLAKTFNFRFPTGI
jgi:hypothetical protein